MVRWGEKNDNIAREVAIYVTGIGIVLLSLGLWLYVLGDNTAGRTTFDVPAHLFNVLFACVIGGANLLAGGLVFLTRSRLSIVIAAVVNTLPLVVFLISCLYSGIAFARGYLFLWMVTCFVYFRAYKAIQEINAEKRESDAKDNSYPDSK